MTRVNGEPHLIYILVPRFTLNRTTLPYDI